MGKRLESYSQANLHCSRGVKVPLGIKDSQKVPSGKQFFLCGSRCSNSCIHKHLHCLYCLAALSDRRGSVSQSELHMSPVRAFHVPHSLQTYFAYNVHCLYCLAALSGRRGSVSQSELNMSYVGGIPCVTFGADVLCIYRSGVHL